MAGKADFTAISENSESRVVADYTNCVDCSGNYTPGNAGIVKPATQFTMPPSVFQIPLALVAEGISPADRP
jgi:hypothetical protein